MSAERQAAISLPGEPTRPVSEDSGRHVYLTERVNGSAISYRVESITPNGVAIARIGGLAMSALESFGLSTQGLARDMSTVVLRTTQTKPSLRNPLGWDARLQTAKGNTPLYEYHPNRQPEPVQLQRVIYQAQDAGETHIHQITVDTPNVITAEQVASSFVSGGHRIKPDGTLESPISWGDTVGNIVQNPINPGQRWEEAPKQAAEVWTKQANGEAPFIVSVQ